MIPTDTIPFLDESGLVAFELPASAFAPVPVAMVELTIRQFSGLTHKIKGLVYHDHARLHVGWIPCMDESLAITAIGVTAGIRPKAERKKFEPVKVDPFLERIRFTLHTRPHEGAEVSINGKPAGLTPLDLDMPLAAAEESRFSFELHGYEPLSCTLRHLREHGFDLDLVPVPTRPARPKHPDPEHGLGEAEEAQAQAQARSRMQERSDSLRGPYGIRNAIFSRQAAAQIVEEDFDALRAAVAVDSMQPKAAPFVPLPPERNQASSRVSLGEARRALGMPALEPISRAAAAFMASVKPRGLTVGDAMATAPDVGINGLVTAKPGDLFGVMTTIPRRLELWLVGPWTFRRLWIQGDEAVSLPAAVVHSRLRTFFADLPPGTVKVALLAREDVATTTAEPPEALDGLLLPGDDRTRGVYGNLPVMGWPGYGDDL